jgi:predicted O-linked N-acetylglucosamine transferase (SPINDLY family)
LRLGFVSPDLGRHPVGYFVVPLLENLPGLEFETVCYSDRIGDDLTGRIQAAAGAWRETRGVSDEDLGQMIVGDGIDILIDLSGHGEEPVVSLCPQASAPTGHLGGIRRDNGLVRDRLSGLRQVFYGGR